MHTALIWILAALAVLAGLALIWFALTAFLIAPGRYPKPDPARLLPAGSEPTPIAHRGLHDNDAGVPENSLAAFRAALDAGFGIEFDLNLTADDQIVVFHDDTLERVCGDPRRVCDCTYEELSRLRLFDTDERIPLFSELLALVAGRQTMIVEFKTPPRLRLLCEKAYAMLREYDGPYCIESFHPNTLRWFRKNAPGVVRGQLAGPAALYPKRWMGAIMGASLTNFLTRPHFSAYLFIAAPRRVTQRLYRLFGGKTAAWTVRSAEDYRLCRRYFDAVIFEGRDTVPPPKS